VCCCSSCLSSTDFSRTNNINGILTGLWPCIAQAITDAITQDVVVMQMVPDHVLLAHTPQTHQQLFANHT
jgi:hypothetical protein